MAATGWQEHSIRAALTGLRKTGHTISRERDDGSATYYRIAEVV
jgi:DNA-binding transcriptional regulator PaaX